MGIITVTVSLELTRMAEGVQDEDARSVYNQAVKRMDGLVAAMTAADIKDETGENLFDVMTYLSAGSFMNDEKDALSTFIGRFLTTMHEWSMGPLKGEAIGTAKWEDGTLTLSASPGKRSGSSPIALVQRMKNAVAFQAHTPSAQALERAAAEALGLDINDLKKTG
jgi:hypothetical protein